MKNLFKLFIAVFVVMTSAAEAVPVRDPARIMEKVDHFLGNVSFHRALAKGDWAQYLSRDCMDMCDESGNCERTCSEWVESNLHVESVDLRKAVIVSSAEESKTELTKEIYDAFNGNLLRMMLAGTSFGFNAFMQSVEIKNEKSFVNVDRVEYGETSFGDLKLPHAKVSMTLHMWIEEFQDFIPFPMTATLAKGVPGIAQMLHIGFSEDSGTFLAGFGRK